MSEIQRYGITHGLLNSYESEDGKWILYDDHAAEVARLEGEVERLTQQKKWVCFHCDFATSDEQEARAHFGDCDDASEFTPLCKWWSNMDDQERKEQFQALIQELNSERERDDASDENSFIGAALLEAIKKHYPNYNWNTCPSEIVLHLVNENASLKAQLAAIHSREKP